ncbi:opioid-binding protein/cell adhesion molecule-like [Mya arenaria]|uniref:opioid-binding protein/cell adhesion molecule-like n=1 Tax=Mya arenaria TaxID=6604 RepID=UPI0022E989EF|nr:opioid-binding protein/cell adhesion molecule-like [Mya arenaria]XP_052814513.1 opioid-binding protein/cell adhesion molecule-like [Mya arenaria]
MTGLSLLIVISLSSVLSANYQPVFNDAVSEVKAIAGSTAVLPCTVMNKGEHTIIWMNPKRILFSNEDKIVIDDKRVGVINTAQGDWNLRLEHVRYNDSGEYSCLLNTKPVKIKRVYLFVQVPAHILNQESSRNMDVEEGRNVTLQCKATGVPQPNITWFRRPFIALESKEYLSPEGEKLHITDIQRFQAGVYVCLAYNGVPPAVTREMEVHVQYTPVVKLLNTRLGQSLGKETILECSVTSYPRARIAWIKNGMSIKHSYKYRLELYPGNHNTYILTLQIVTINVHDYGDYTCEAENRMGAERATMTLYEYKDPTPSPPPTTTTAAPRRKTSPMFLPGYDYYDPYMPGYQNKHYEIQSVLADGGQQYDGKGYDGAPFPDRQGYMRDGSHRGGAAPMSGGMGYMVALSLLLFHNCLN